MVASIPAEASKSHLFVEIAPKDAGVRILNIKPKFHQGIELEPGSYHVEVSLDGYETEKMWVRLDAGEDKKVAVNLEQLQASIQPTTTHIRRPSSTSFDEGLEAITKGLISANREMLRNKKIAVFGIIALN